LEDFLGQLLVATSVHFIRPAWVGKNNKNLFL